MLFFRRMVVNVVKPKNRGFLAISARRKFGTFTKRIKKSFNYKKKEAIVWVFTVCIMYSFWKFDKETYFISKLEEVAKLKKSLKESGSEWFEDAEGKMKILEQKEAEIKEELVRMREAKDNDLRHEKEGEDSDKSGD